MTDAVEYALTLHRPWAGAICYLHEDFAKRVENRSWKPPKSLIGKRIAIHAGKQWDEVGWQEVRSNAAYYGFTLPENERTPFYHIFEGFFRGGIVATARVYGCIDENEDLVMGSFPRESRCKPPGPMTGQVKESWIQEHVMDWFSGPYGWVLGDVDALPVHVECNGRQLPVPVECNGRQKLWRLPPRVAQALSCVSG